MVNAHSLVNFYSTHTVPKRCVLVWVLYISIYVLELVLDRASWCSGVVGNFDMENHALDQFVVFISLTRFKSLVARFALNKFIV